MCGVRKESRVDSRVGVEMEQEGQRDSKRGREEERKRGRADKRKRGQEDENKEEERKTGRDRKTENIETQASRKAEKRRREDSQQRRSTRGGAAVRTVAADVREEKERGKEGGEWSEAGSKTGARRPLHILRDVVDQEAHDRVSWQRDAPCQSCRMRTGIAGSGPGAHASHQCWIGHE